MLRNGDLLVERGLVFRNSDLESSSTEIKDDLETTQLTFSFDREATVQHIEGEGDIVATLTRFFAEPNQRVAEMKPIIPTRGIEVKIPLELLIAALEDENRRLGHHRDCEAPTRGPTRGS